MDQSFPRLVGPETCLDPRPPSPHRRQDSDESPESAFPLPALPGLGPGRGRPQAGDSGGRGPQAAAEGGCAESPKALAGGREFEPLHQEPQPPHPGRAPGARGAAGQAHRPEKCRDLAAAAPCPPDRLTLQPLQSAPAERTLTGDVETVQESRPQRFPRSGRGEAGKRGPCGFT